MYQLLYHPHIGEVFPQMLNLREMHRDINGLHQRSIKAEQILLNHEIFWDDNWFVQSQTTPYSAYHVTDSSCECNDKGTLIAGSPYCKHKIAFRIYSKIMIAHLNNLAQHRIDVTEKFSAQWNDKLSCLVFGNDSELNMYKFSRWLAVDGGRHCRVNSIENIIMGVKQK